MGSRSIQPVNFHPREAQKVQPGCRHSLRPSAQRPTLNPSSVQEAIAPAVKGENEKQPHFTDHTPKVTLSGQRSSFEHCGGLTAWVGTPI